MITMTSNINEVNERSTSKMSIYGLVLTIIVAMMATAPNLSAQTVITIRGSEQATRDYCVSKSCALREISAEAKEFANGNTFVRFNESVAGEDIVIPLTRSLNADQFLELLIKVRTARSGFAKSIEVTFPFQGPENPQAQVVGTDGKQLISNLLFNQLITTAGATGINGRQLKALPLENPQSLANRKPVVVDLGTNSSLAKDIAKELNCEIMTSVSDLLSSKQFQRDASQSLYIVVSSVADPHNESLLMSLEAVNQIKVNGNGRSRNPSVLLLSPYLPYARSDKMDQDGVAVIGRLAADMIETSKADAVQFIRAHAPQSQGFFSRPSIQTMGRDSITQYLRKIGVQQVVSPDAGFQKDATLYADDLKVPVSVINKQRNLKTGESQLRGISGPGVKGKIVAVIDDETASGGTLAKAAQLLKEKGAKQVIAVVTHLAGNAKQALQSPHIDKMVVTNTFEVSAVDEKLQVISLANEIVFDLKTKVFNAIKCSQAYR